MKDMKITAAEEKAEKSKYEKSPMGGGSAGRYPYGLEVRLDSAGLKKLGMETLPKVGKKYTLCASVVVTEARSSQRQGGDDDRSLSLQIQKMELETGSVTDAIDEVM